MRSAIKEWRTVPTVEAAILSPSQFPATGGSAYSPSEIVLATAYCMPEPFDYAPWNGLAQKMKA